MKRYFEMFRKALVLIAILLLFYLSVNFGLERLLSLFREIDIYWFLLVCVCVSVNFILVVLRYRYLVSIDLPLRGVAEVVASSFLLNYASMVPGVGAVAKVGMLKEWNIPVVRSSVAVGFELILDVFFCTFVLAISLHFLPFDFKVNYLLIFPVLLAAVILLFILRKIVISKIRFLNGFLLEVRSVVDRGGAIRLSLYTLGIWLSVGLGLHCLLLAFSSAQEIFISVISVLIGFVAGLGSLVPGGLAARELSISVFIGAHGGDVEKVAVVALLYRLLFIFLMVIFYFFLYANRSACRHVN
ncbi:lysylphosphatidylglycerol synthase transmembrane domain-containing protein [Aurantivibrio plasticivorans]